jgi:hypothetical protein
MDGETPLTKRLRRMPSDPLLDVSSGEELSLFTTTQNSSNSSQVCSSDSFLVFTNNNPLDLETSIMLSNFRYPFIKI